MAKQDKSGNCKLCGIWRHVLCRDHMTKMDAQRLGRMGAAARWHFKTERLS